MIDIKYENAKYIIDANLHVEVGTSDIAEAQEHFLVDCASEFAEKIKEVVNTANLINKKKQELIIGGK